MILVCMMMRKDIKINTVRRLWWGGNFRGKIGGNCPDDLIPLYPMFINFLLQNSSVNCQKFIFGTKEGKKKRLYHQCRYGIK